MWYVIIARKRHIIWLISRCKFVVLLLLSCYITLVWANTSLPVFPNSIPKLPQTTDPRAQLFSTHWLRFLTPPNSSIPHGVNLSHNSVDADNSAIAQEEWVKKILLQHPTRDEAFCPMALDRQAMGLLPEILYFLQRSQIAPAAKDAPLFIVSDEPPPGFASLNEPQTTLLNVYYDGQSLGAFEATFTPTWVQLTHPLELLEHIATVNDKAQVAKALSGRLTPNANLVCQGKRPTPVCSLPALEDAAVVFDINTYRLDLFVAPKHLNKTVTSTSVLLPPPTAGLSFSDGMNLLISGSNQADSATSYNFIQQGALADGAKRINYQLSYAQNNSGNNNGSNGGFSLQQLNAEWDYKQYVTQIGYIETTGDTFIGNQNILGVSWGTTLNTLRSDQRSLYGSSLVVFLSLPSQVSIYRDNRLISSGFYQAGDQIIDTSGLPAGSYPITLKIQDNLGNTREENRFYVSSALIPPKDYPIYYAHVGYLTDLGSSSVATNQFLPQSTTTLLYQLGLNKRIGDSWGVNVDTIGSAQNAYLGGGFFFLLPYYQLQLQPQAVIGNHKDYGLALTSSAYVGPISLNLTARKLWAGNASSTSDNNTRVDTATFAPLAQNQSQLNFAVGYTIGQTSLNLMSQWSQAADSPASYSYGLNTRTRLHRFKNGYLELDFSGARSSTDPFLGMVSLSWNINTPTSNSVISAGYQKDQGVSTNSGPLLSANTTWTHYDEAQQGISLGANINHTANEDSVGINVNELNHYLNATGQAQYTRQAQSDANNSAAMLQYNTNIGSRLVWSEGSAPIWGGARSQQAGTVIHIDSDSPGQAFQLLNDRQVVGVIKTDSTTPVFLNAYQVYPLSIKAVSKDFFTYDERPKDVVLYPGNYQFLTWKARQKLIIFTQVLLPNHQPLASARVEGSVDYNYTDEQGYIQLEVFQDTRELEFQQSSEQRCKVQLPKDIKVENSFATLNAVICVPLPGTKPMHSSVASS